MEKKENLVDKYMSSLLELVEEGKIDVAISVAASVFVSLTTSYVKARGEDPNVNITINGGNGIDVTIHAPKKV